MPEPTAAGRLLAQYYEIPADAAQAAWDHVVGAWKQAMAEFGVSEHPGGKCPTPDCPCSPLAELVSIRAEELLGLPVAREDG